MKRLDARLAYRWLEVKSDYNEGLLDKPLVATHRAFLTLSYATKPSKADAQWKFDITSQYVGFGNRLLP